MTDIPKCLKYNIIANQKIRHKINNKNQDWLCNLF